MTVTGCPGLDPRPREDEDERDADEGRHDGVEGTRRQDSSRVAPMTDPMKDSGRSRRSVGACPVSSCRYPQAPLAPPATRPTVFDTLAASGLTPKKSSVGKVMSVPEPTIVLIMPAPVPASAMATADQNDTRPP